MKKYIYFQLIISSLFLFFSVTNAQNINYKNKNFIPPTDCPFNLYEENKTLLSIGKEDDSSNNGRIKSLKNFLIGYHGFDSSDSNVSNYFGKQTENNLKLFQFLEKLPQTGVVDSITSIRIGNYCKKNNSEIYNGENLLFQSPEMKNERINSNSEKVKIGSFVFDNKTGGNVKLTAINIKFPKGTTNTLNTLIFNNKITNLKVVDENNELIGSIAIPQIDVDNNLSLSVILDEAKSKRFDIFVDIGSDSLNKSITPVVSVKFIKTLGNVQYSTKMYQVTSC